MGKKLHKNAAKSKFEAMQNERNARLSVADDLLARWGDINRIQLPGGQISEPLADPDTTEDEMTAEVINCLNQQNREIAHLHWSEGMAPSDIAEAMAVHRNIVRREIAFIRDLIASKVLS